MNVNVRVILESLIAAWLDERKPVVLMDGCAPADYKGFPPQGDFTLIVDGKERT